MRQKNILLMLVVENYLIFFLIYKNFSMVYINVLV